MRYFAGANEGDAEGVFEHNFHLYSNETVDAGVIYSKTRGIMRSWIVGLVITALSIGCQKDNIGPPELLYQRWKLGDNTYFLTFRPDGIILHGQDSQDTYCCSPRFFLLQGNRINLKDAPSKPLPAGIREADCGYVRCAGPGDSWQIVELTAQRLVLAQPWGQQVYKAD